MSPSTVVCVTIFLAIFVYNILSRVIRRSHRLPPGPKPWPIIGNLPLLRGSAPHRTLAALARTYGPIMHLRLGSVHVVVASSASAASQFLKTNDAKFSDRPPHSSFKHISYDYQDMGFQPYGPRWRLLRKISFEHMFSAKALDDYRHIREDEVSVLLRALRGGSSNPVKLGQLLNACISNVLGRVMIGRKVFKDSKTGDSDPKADEFKSMVVEIMIVAGEFNIGDFIPAIEWLDLQGVAARMKKLFKRLDAFLSEILEERKTCYSGQHSDMLETLLSLREGADTEEAGGKLTDTEIKALLSDLFVAGGDTSLSLVEWLIAELLRHPRVMARLKEELDTIVGRDRIVTELDLPQLPYLQAVVKEALRLHPSTPLSLPRMATESCEINGCHIPKGSTLLVNIYAISRDPREWVDPLVFRPERFLPSGDKGHVSVTGTHFELIPFGAGRRICPGMSLAWRITQILAASLVHAFDWELPAGLKPQELNMDEAYGLALQKKEPLLVHPRPRLASHLYS